jgi:transposase
MRKYKIEEEAIATSTKVWLGIDAHKQTLHLTLIDAQEVLWQGSVPHAREHVEALIGRLVDCEIVAAYESGPTGYKLLHWLKELGCEAFMTPASKVRTEKGGKQIKTDQRDSLELAELARADMLKEVYDLGEQGYRDRELTRTRQQLVEHRSSLCAQIKSKLLFHGVERPQGLKANWSKAYLNWLEEGPSGHRYIDEAIKSLVRMYRELTKEIKSLDKQIEELAKSETYQREVELLKSVPGIGVMTAVLLLVELGDISRFERCEEFASFLGLIPGEWSSGETRRKRSIVRWGNKRARTALVESSWTLIGNDPPMREVYDGIKQRRGSGRAIVAVARRLGLAIRAMLRDEEPYNYGAANRS